MREFPNNTVKCSVWNNLKEEGVVSVVQYLPARPRSLTVRTSQRDGGPTQNYTQENQSQSTAHWEWEGAGTYNLFSWPACCGFISNIIERIDFYTFNIRRWTHLKKKKKERINEYADWKLPCSVQSDSGPWINVSGAYVKSDQPITNLIVWHHNNSLSVIRLWIRW